MKYRLCTHFKCTKRLPALKSKCLTKRSLYSVVIDNAIINLPLKYIANQQKCYRNNTNIKKTLTLKQKSCNNKGEENENSRISKTRIN